MLQARLKAFIVSSLFLAASGGSFYFSPAFFIFAAAPGYVAVYGKPMNINRLKTISKALLYLFFLAISGAVVFSVAYVNTLESKGYIQCRGIPSGWLPGTAVKYAVEDDACKSKGY